MKHPNWALKHKRKGTELRFINGNYYLYEVSSKWNPDKKRAQKITGKLLGKITPEGFIKSQKRKLENEIPRIDKIIVKEYGACNFILEYMKKHIKYLQTDFKDLWHLIIGVAFLRLVHQSPIKNMPFFYRHSYMSVIFSSVSLTEKKISVLLRDLGNSRDNIVRYFRRFIKEEDHVIIDATNIFSKSEKILYSKLGYNNKKIYIPQVNLLFIFSSDLRMPVYYRLTPGDIREVRAFRLSLEESGISNAVLIADKGFYSKDNIQLIEKEGLKYIIPLKRNSQLIDYSPLQKVENRDGYFKYNKRYIWYYTHQLKDMIVITYFDESLRGMEEKDYLNRIETHPEEYTLEGFYSKQQAFGTLTLISNVETENAENLYCLYKSKTNIENMFDIMKNLLNADRTYMQNEAALEGWMFVNYIALQWYYQIYQLMTDKKLLSKYSPKDLLLYLCEIKKVKICDTWKISEISKKLRNLIDKLELNLHIT